MELILQSIQEHGLETVVMAVIVTMLTGAIKLPIKYLAQKYENLSGITKYITFLPVILGFAVNAVYLAVVDEFIADEVYLTTSLTVGSISLAIYAFIEKFAPSKKKILEEVDVQAGLELVKALESKLLGNQDAETAEPETVEEPEPVADTAPETAQEDGSQHITIGGKFKVIDRNS